MFLASRSIRATMLAVAVAAIAMSALRDSPFLWEGYHLSRGVRSARYDLVRAGALQGAQAAACVERAGINVRQSEMQLADFLRKRTPGTTLLLWSSVAGLSLIGFAITRTKATKGYSGERAAANPNC